MIECPQCKTPLDVYATVPKEQVIYFKITNDGGPFSLRTIGETISGAERLMKATAKDGGYRVQVFLHSVEHKPGEFKFGMMIVDQPDRRRKQPAEES